MVYKWKLREKYSCSISFCWRRPFFKCYTIENVPVWVRKSAVTNTNSVRLNAFSVEQVDKNDRGVVIILIDTIWITFIHQTTILLIN